MYCIHYIRKVWIPFFLRETDPNLLANCNGQFDREARYIKYLQILKKGGILKIHVLYIYYT